MRSRNSIHHQHIQIEKLAETVDAVIWHNHIHQQQPAILGHGSAAISKDGGSLIIVPIVNHPA
jgi:hypothetical protein